MNVEQYFEQELEIKGVDMMGDEIPVDSNCGHSCKLAIDAAKQLIVQISEGRDIYNCDARYAFIGHIYEGFGPDYGYLDEIHDKPGIETIRKMVTAICQVYIFG